MTKHLVDFKDELVNHNYPKILKELEIRLFDPIRSDILEIPSRLDAYKIIDKEYYSFMQEIAYIRVKCDVDLNSHDETEINLNILAIIMLGRYYNEKISDWDFREIVIEKGSDFFNTLYEFIDLDDVESQAIEFHQQP